MTTATSPIAKPTIAADGDAIIASWHLGTVDSVGESYNPLPGYALASADATGQFSGARLELFNAKGEPFAHAIAPGKVNAPAVNGPVSPRLRVPADRGAWQPVDLVVTCVFERGTK